jgi:6-phosphogluconolactonase (cycloisomerase 2 family)
VLRSIFSGGTRVVLVLAALLAALVAASSSTFAAPAKGNGNAGAVYTLNNSLAGNAVLVYDRAADGTLTYAGSVPTGGLGTGASLGSQGALVLSDNGRWLLAVNAGSDDVSVFAVGPSRLILTDRVPSGGDHPNSVAIHNDLVYVLNSGGAGNINGFQLSHDGTLHAIAGSSRPFSGPATTPSQVSFAPDGRVLAVTERATQQISTYVVGADGLTDGPHTFASSGPAPFGFGFDKRGNLIVSEAANGSVSSYHVGVDGTVSPVTASLVTTQNAACWIVVTHNGKFAYSANAGSASISGFAISHDGSLSMLDADGVTGATGPGSGPIDMALSNNSHFLYALSARSGQMIAFAVESDGSLTALPGVTSTLLNGAAGLAAS